MLQAYDFLFLRALVETIISILAFNAPSCKPIFLASIGLTVYNVILLAFVPGR